MFSKKARSKFEAEKEIARRTILLEFGHHPLPAYAAKRHKIDPKSWLFFLFLASLSQAE
jgi:hypothetical protein